MRRLRALRQPRLRPAARLAAADPGRGAGRLPDGVRTPSARRAASTAARSCAAACSAWRPSTRRDQLDWGSVWESAVAAGRRADAEEHRRASTSTAATTASTCIVPIDAADFAIYNRSAPTSPACSGPSAGGKVGTTVDAAAPAARSAFANPLVSGHRQQRRHQGPRHALRRRHRRRRVRPRGLPGRRLHAAQPLALREPRLLVRRRARSRCRPAGSGAGSTPTARPTTRCRRSRSTQLAVEADPLDQGARVRDRGPQRRRASASPA